MQIAYRRLLPQRLRHWLRSMVVECGIPTCRGFHLSHPILRRLPGIFLDQTWYCSPECLREALKQRVETQLGAAVTDLRHPPRMPFRLILLSGGKVSAEQLEQARELQSQSSGPGTRDLGDALVTLGFVTEDEVAAARASEAGCLFFGGAIQPVVSAYTLPLTLMRLHHAAPVHYSPVTGRLLIGFVYRIDNPLLQAVEQVIGCRAEACIITAAAWKQLVSHNTPIFEEVNDAASSQGRIVSMIVDHAITSLADKVRVGLSHSALWARLAGGPRGRDLIIDLAANGLPTSDDAESTIEVGARQTSPSQTSPSRVPVAPIRASISPRAAVFPVF
jgi:hypothetical protein